MSWRFLRMGGALAEELAVLSDIADQFMGLGQRRYIQGQVGLARVEALGHPGQILVGQSKDGLVGRIGLLLDSSAGMLQDPGGIAPGQSDDAPEVPVRLSPLPVELTLAHRRGMRPHLLGASEECLGLARGIELAFILGNLGAHPW